MHQVIAGAQHDSYVIVRPGARKGIRIPAALYRELLAAQSEGRPVPEWLSDAAERAWGLNLGGSPTRGTVLVRPPTLLRYSRASYEINKGCNYDCEHCYLAERKFAGLPLEEKKRLLVLLRDAGVLWLQFTGGEPTIDRDFEETYRQAYGLGMMIEILTNGSRLHQPRTIDLLVNRPPHKVTVSLYGATGESYDALTRKKGAFRLLLKGLAAAREAGVTLELALIITRRNAHEVQAMRALAAEHAASFTEYGNMSPTYDGRPDPLAAQAPGFLDRSSVFTGCPAGHTFFHVDPHGLVTMCKVGRENPVDVMSEGLAGLTRLPAVADAQMLRTGGCGGCALSAACRVCRPLAKAYQDAKAPLNTYCRHGDEVSA